MRVLFIGGTGIISTACTQMAAARGIDLTLVRRGLNTKVAPPAGVKTVVADLTDFEGAQRALDGLQFDAVVDWIGYTPEDMERGIALFRERTKQFVFISSASAYQKPQTHYLITESTPLANPYWQYSRDKIAGEDRLMRAYREEGFPVTIVRPSHTYGDTQFTLAINSWERSYTVVDRMRQGKKVIVPGDGTSLWVLTHNTDFGQGLLGLLGLPKAIGHAFHITSDEVMTWDRYYRITAEAAGVSDPQIVHIPSDFISACLPDKLGGLTGDKAVSVVFDNSKIKQFVPAYRAVVPYHEGVRRTVAWFDGDDSRKLIDDEANARWDKLIDVYERGLAQAVAEFTQTAGRT